MPPMHVAFPPHMHGVSLSPPLAWQALPQSMHQAAADSAATNPPVGGLDARDGAHDTPAGPLIHAGLGCREGEQDRHGQVGCIAFSKCPAGEQTADHGNHKLLLTEAEVSEHAQRVGTFGHVHLAHAGAPLAGGHALPGTDGLQQA